MKHTKLFVGTACAVSLFALGVSAHATTASQVPIYSVAKGNDHYLTTDYNRAQALISQGYNAFPIVGELPTTSGTQIHSWYSSTAGHYLTVDDSASNQARLTALGYTEMDGTTGLYAASSTDAGAVPMYVWYNAQASHYYNTDETTCSIQPFTATAQLHGMVLLHLFQAQHLQTHLLLQQRQQWVRLIFQTFLHLQPFKQT